MLGRRASAAVPVLLTILAAGTALAEGDDVARAQPGDTAAAFPDPTFGPRYTIESVVVRGNDKTKTALILGEIDALGLRPGTAVDASDARVEAARYRLLALGYFLDVRLSLARGSARGAAVLIVQVEERGTIVINELFPSTSAATLFWGGADVSETNFLGRGLSLGAGFVASTRPVVLDAHRGLGVRLRGSVPPLGGPLGPSLTATGLYADGSEFYRVSGDDDDTDPGRYIASRARRAGAVLGVGKSFRTGLHATVDFREELVAATVPALPPGQKQALDFMIKNGASRVGTVMIGVDLDTRSDPVLPRSGMRVALTLETASGLFGSSYEYVKAVAEGSFYHPMPHGHALGLHVFAGAIGGDAPYFDRFFIGDLNLLLPRRALGINFSTLPSRNLLGTSIAHHRYDDYAGRLLVEYAVPIWRRHGFVYGGDFFAAAGVLAMASPGDVLPDGSSGWSALPIDLTGDVGLRLDTYVGIFTISIANALSRSSF